MIRQRQTLIIILFFLISTTAANAQIEKGNLLVSVVTGASFIGNKKDNQIFLTFCPGIFKVVNHNFAVGANFNYDLLSGKESSNQGHSFKFTSETIEFGTVARKYFTNSRLKPYGELGFGYQIANYKRYYKGEFISQVVTRDLYLKPVVGLSYWINEFASIDANVGYTFVVYHYDPFYYQNWKFRMGLTLRSDHLRNRNSKR